MLTLVFLVVTISYLQWWWWGWCKWVDGTCNFNEAELSSILIHCRSFHLVQEINYSIKTETETH